MADPALRALARAAEEAERAAPPDEALPVRPVPVILLVAGLAVSGRLVGPRAYLARLPEFFKPGSAEARREELLALIRTAKGGGEESEPERIHLVEAFIGGGVNSQVRCLSIELSAVSGWTLGSISKGV